MSSQDVKDATQLQTLERLRTSELERAQTQLAVRQQAVAERERVVEKVQGVIDESQSLARAQAEDAQIISVEALTRIRHFTATQFEELKQAEQSLEESQRDAADARTVLVRRFEELSVVERLRERRMQQAQKQTLRKEQNRLDDQALMRTSADTSRKNAKVRTDHPGGEE